MRILLVGANGLIGSAADAAFRSHGHDVVPVLRRPMARQRPHVVLDLARATSPAAWVAHLEGVDVVVNCAGVLQDGGGDSARAVHADGAAALFAACETTGVKRVLHLSAIGVDRASPTEFSRTKLAGEKALTSRSLDWVILRPSVVLGRPAYGGSALFRGLAALPVVPEVPDAGELQVVQLDDLVRTMLFFVEPNAPARVAVDVAGPERLTTADVVARYRRWLGWPPARTVRLPGWSWRLAYRLGDAAGMLGWRPPVRTTARIEMRRGAIGDNTAWRSMTGIVPATLDAALDREPASVQERWFARMYLLKPVVFVVFSAFWLATGLVSLGPGWDIGMELLTGAGVAQVAPLAIVAGALADIAIGLGIAIRRTTRYALYAALAISLVYVAIGTLLVPGLWADPLGPMMKIWPILALNLVALAILEDR